MYFNVGKLAITQYVSAITAKNFMVAELKMLSSFASILGIVFSLSGTAVIVLGLDRLSLRKCAHRTALYIQKVKENPGENLRRDG